MHVWPLGGGQYTGFAALPAAAARRSRSARATAVGLALFLGCTGKSAQIPLYVWLPDAMAGPTPVSALIHAATMVTAGVYLVCRLSFVFVLSPFAMMVIAIIGAATALFAATIALVQNDIKKVLAYSTVSQLGFMFLGVGVGAFTAGLLPRLHARVLQGLPLPLRRHRSSTRCTRASTTTTRSQDMRNMGGLRKYMPLTLLDVRPRRRAAIIGLPAHERLLLEGRDPLPRVRRPHGEPVRGSGSLDGARLVRAAARGSGPALYCVGARRRDDDGVLHVPRSTS